MRASQFNLNAEYITQLLKTTAYLPGTTLYYPGAVATHTSGLAMWPFRNVSLDLYMVAGAGTTVTVTVEGTNTSNVLVAADWKDITKSTYDAVTNTYNNTNYATAVAGTLNAFLHLDDANYRYVRYKVVSSAGANSTVYLATRQVPR